MTGCSAIPAPFRERMAMAYETGKRIVQMVLDDLKPSDILSRESFENAIVVNAAIGGSTNAPPHLQAIARHAGIELNVRDWETIGFEVPLILNMQPAGEYLGESFFRAGGIPAVMGELMKAGLIRQGAMTDQRQDPWPKPERLGQPRWRGDPHRRRSLARKRGLSGPVKEPVRQRADEDQRDLKGISATASCPAAPRAFTRLAPSSLRAPGITTTASNALGIDETCILFIRNVGCVGYPGNAGW